MYTRGWVISRWMLLGVFAFALTVGFTPRQVAAASKSDGRATVAVAFVPRQSANDVLSYDITARNQGDGVAYYTNVVVPIDTTQLQVVNAKLIGTPAWLPTNKANLIEFRIERLNGGEAATLSLDVRKLSAEATWSTPLSFSWNDADGRHTSQSNTPKPFQDVYPANVNVSGDTATFSSDLFAAGEPVTIWYNAPDGSVNSLSVAYNTTVITAENDDDDLTSHTRPDVLAGPDGTIFLSWNLSSLPSGSYSLVAHGNWTGITAIAPFQK